MCFIIQLGVDTFYVMVVHKIIQLQSIRTVTTHFIETFYGMRNFKVIVIVMSGIQGLMQMIVGDGMQGSFIDPADIISVNDLTHQPELWLHCIGCLTKSLHKIKIQNVCSIQTNTVNIECFHPETNHITDVIPYFRITLVQFHQKIIATPVLVGKTIVIFIVAVEIHIAVPVAVERIFTVLQNIFKCKKIASGVIEYAIQNDPDTLTVTFFYKINQVFIRTQTTVQLLIISCFVTMSHRFKQRSDIQCITSKIMDMSDPWKQCIQPMNWLLVSILLWCSCQTQWVYMIKNSFIVPCHNDNTSKKQILFLL